MTLTLANLLQRFLGHYMPVQRGLSTNTVLAYRDTLRLLLCYAADKTGKPVDKLWPVLSIVDTTNYADFFSLLKDSA